MFETRLFRSAVALTVLLGLSETGSADTYPRQNGVDAIHYRFGLTLSDADDRITGETVARFRVDAALTDLSLDLGSAAGSKGMTVSQVTVDGTAVKFTHTADRLRIQLPARPASSTDITVAVSYSGIPADGLRIIKNIHGERTAFSENWPNHARQWLPTIDHPYDKATGEFVVSAPAQYQVVANGLLVEEVDLPGGLRRTHWKQSVPIASWLFALGMARFAVHHYDVVRGIPQQVWVFPQDREKGYEVFEFTGRRAFEFFTDRIGPYAYEKLGHVQAAGLGGATEHASAIFYGEKGVAGGRAPVVHEVAHQWWGNSVTEKDWDDVWLSEGFATYFTHLYTEHFEGRDAFLRGLRSDIELVAQEERRTPDKPVIHQNLSDMSLVLNRLVYQKAGWVLHMLRGVVGTERFWSGIREYYRRYRDQNASTDDFRQIMEHAAGTDLSWFFDQWLKRAGMPKIKGTWAYDASARRIHIDLSQAQSGPPFRVPLEIGISAGSARPLLTKIELLQSNGRFVIDFDREPSSVVLDPNTWVLMETPEFSKRN
jgi:aminopeptidase N